MPFVLAALALAPACSGPTDTYATTGGSSEPADAVVTDMATGLSAPPSSSGMAGPPASAPARAAFAEITGRYEIIERDGSSLLLAITPDRRFTVTRDGENLARGTMEHGADGSICARYASGERRCFMLSTPAPDGSFAVQSDDGTIARGRRLDPAPAQATAPRTS